MFPGYKSKFLETDPEFIERFDNFAFDEVVNEDGIKLDQKKRMNCILAVLLGCQGIDEFKAILPAAMNFGVTPVEAKEIVYQTVDYLGIGRIIESVDLPKAPMRMVLGSQALQATITRLKERIADYETQAELAASTDIVE